jgi:hypothetical protein
MPICCFFTRSSGLLEWIVVEYHGQHDVIYTLCIFSAMTKTLEQEDTRPAPSFSKNTTACDEKTMARARQILVVL